MDDTHWTTDRISEAVDEILNDRVYMTEVALRNKHVSFVGVYPKLFNLLKGSPESQVRAALEPMLQRRISVENGSKTKDEADRQTGEEMAEKYIYPKTGRPDPAELQKAITKVEKQLSLENQ